MRRCKCGDSGCPVCRGSCENRPTIVLVRVDMEDYNGTCMCAGCANDALESGLFRADIGAKIRQRV